MRLFILIFFVFLSNQVFSQHLTGLVIDEATRKPINNARVATSSNATYTTSTGSFILNNFHYEDTVTVSHLGYEAYHIKHSNRSKTDTLLILLKSSSIVLEEVRVNGIRNYSLDSLNKRKEYAAFYAYKAPKFKDIFITKSPYVSTQYSPFQSSTSSLISINLLSVIGLLSKNNAPVSKMQKQLLKDEEYNYVDHVFSKEKVQSLTSLKGDSLQNFMNEYRPSIKELKQMTDYQILLYIKKSYDTFNKTYKHEILPSLEKIDSDNLKRFAKDAERHTKNNIFILVGAILSIIACNNEKISQKNEADSKLKYSIYSKNVRDSFYISVQLPLEYKEKPKKKYPVVFLTDANFFSPMLAPILHQYEKGGLLPPLILVSVGYKSFDLMDSLRVRDYMFPASIPSDEMKAIGGGRKFYHFLIEELLPKIDSNYRADIKKRTLLGHSFGGYFSLFALSEQIENKRNDFTGFVSASPTLWYNNNYLFNLPKKLNDSDLIDSLNVFLSVGAKEEPKWSVQPVKDFSKRLSNARISKIKNQVEVYSHLDHMDVGIISFIKGLEQIYNKEVND